MCVPKIVFHSLFFLDLQFSSTTTFVTVDGRGIGNSKPFKPVFTEYKPDLANTKYQPVSFFISRNFEIKNSYKIVVVYI